MKPAIYIRTGASYAHYGTLRHAGATTPTKDVMLVTGGEGNYEQFEVKLTLHIPDANIGDKSVNGLELALRSMKLAAPDHPELTVSWNDPVEWSKIKDLTFDENGDASVTLPLTSDTPILGPDASTLARFNENGDIDRFHGYISSLNVYPSDAGHHIEGHVHGVVTKVDESNPERYTSYSVAKNMSKPLEVAAFQPAFVLEFSDNIGDATADTVATQFNKLVDKMEKCGILQRPNGKA